MGRDLRGRNIGVGYSQRSSDGRYTKQFRIDGVKYTAYGATLQECKRQYEKMLVEIKNGERLSSGSVIFGEYFEYWLSQQLERKAIKESSYSLYKRHYLHIKKFIGRKKFDKITPMDVELIQTQMIQEGYAPKTINAILGMLGSVCNDAVKKDVIIKSPCRAITPVKEKKTDRTNARALSEEEEQAFLEAAKECWYYNAIRLLFATGMRSGEMRGLQWRDFDTKNKVLHIRRTASVDKDDNTVMQTPKTENGIRDIPMNDEIIGIIRDQRQQMLDVFGGDIIGVRDYIFRSTQGKIISRNALKKEFNIISKRVSDRMPGFERISPHACRHTFITRNLMRGCNEFVLKDIVGHAHSARVTADVYLHRDQEAMRAYMEELGKAL